MALCLRIIIEYPIIGNFFKENKYKNKKTDFFLPKKKTKNNTSPILDPPAELLDDKLKWNENQINKNHLSKGNPF